MQEEYVVEFFKGDRKVGGFITLDSSLVQARTAQWAAQGNRYEISKRTRLMEQQDVEAIPEDNYLCQG